MSSVFVALLRGVNVGAHKRLKMDALRQLFSSLGLQGAQTYLQSGNVIFRADEPDALKLAARIESAIEQAFGFHSDIILRTVGQMRAAVEQNAFAQRVEAMDAAKLAVIFLRTAPSSGQSAKLAALDTSPEEIFIGVSELYIYYPNGMGKSKLSGPMLEKVLGTTGTARNWRSATNILTIMEQIKGAA
jgi:uncharacterized protein (DUF1697 family)